MPKWLDSRGRNPPAVATSITGIARRMLQVRLPDATSGRRTNEEQSDEKRRHQRERGHIVSHAFRSIPIPLAMKAIGGDPNQPRRSLQLSRPSSLHDHSASGRPPIQQVCERVPNPGDPPGSRLSGLLHRAVSGKSRHRAVSGRPSGSRLAFYHTQQRQ